MSNKNSVMNDEMRPCLGLSEKLLSALEYLGNGDFTLYLLDWLHDDVGVEQCMVFYCSSEAKVSTLLFKDFASNESAKRLAEAYIGNRRYLQDPNFDIFKACEPGELTVSRLSALSPDMSLSYKKMFFDEPGFQDKLAIIYGTDQGNYYVNLYRRSSQFDADFNDEELTEKLARLVMTLLHKHYQMNQKLLDEGPLAFLSEREQQVCKAVLRGLKNEAIAAELGVATSSVVTYRKRAYEKLGITSRAQLFALCN